MKSVYVYECAVIVPGAICVSHFLKSNFYNFPFKHIMSRVFKIKLLFLTDVLFSQFSLGQKIIEKETLQ